MLKWTSLANSPVLSDHESFQPCFGWSGVGWEGDSPLPTVYNEGIVAEGLISSCIRMASCMLLFNCTYIVHG